MNAGTIARTIVLAIAIINQILVACGVNTIPIAEETVTEFVTLAFTIGAAIAAWWKNNSFTKAAIKGDKVKDAIKSGAVTVETIAKIVR